MEWKIVNIDIATSCYHTHHMTYHGNVHGLHMVYARSVWKIEIKKRGNSWLSIFKCAQKRQPFVARVMGWSELSSFFICPSSSSSSSLNTYSITIEHMSWAFLLVAILQYCTRKKEFSFVSLLVFFFFCLQVWERLFSSSRIINVWMITRMQLMWRVANKFNEFFFLLIDVYWSFTAFYCEEEDNLYTFWLDTHQKKKAHATTSNRRHTLRNIETIN